jgi:hypothetical protein
MVLNVSLAINLEMIWKEDVLVYFQIYTRNRNRMHLTKKKKDVLVLSRYYPGIFMEELSKSVKNITLDS